jgi:hygromycin-B 7''-O-kinase
MQDGADHKVRATKSLDHQTRGQNHSFSMNSFPTMTSVEAFHAWRADPSRWLPAAMDIARDHGLPHTEPHIFPTGTNLVVALNSGLILKIFPTMFRHQFLAERAALTQLRGRLDIAIPEIVLEGDREQWPYLVMTRLAGTLGTQAWPRLPEDQKEIVLGQIGETIVQVQRAPLDGMAELEPRWPQFMSRQIDACRSRHLRLGLPQKFLMGLDDLLREATTLIPMDAPPVLLTGEYIPENFLLESRDGGWRLSGLIDFGDAFTGWSEYDLLGPSAFMTAGKPGRVASLLRGFGYTRADFNPTLTRRLLTLMFLHRASDPLRHICIEGWHNRADSLHDLERMLWPI